jgi:hypothetical protein
MHSAELGLEVDLSTFLFGDDDGDANSYLNVLFALLRTSQLE